MPKESILHQQPALPLLLQILALWIMLYAIAFMCGKHTWYVNFTIKRPAKALWNKLGPKGQGIVIGIMLTLFLIWILSQPR